MGEGFLLPTPHTPKPPHFLKQQLRCRIWYEGGDTEGVDLPVQNHVRSRAALLVGVGALAEEVGQRGLAVGDVVDFVGYTIITKVLFGFGAILLTPGAPSLSL